MKYATHKCDVTNSNFQGSCVTCRCYQDRPGSSSRSLGCCCGRVASLRCKQDARAGRAVIVLSCKGFCIVGWRANDVVRIAVVTRVCHADTASSEQCNLLHAAGIRGSNSSSQAPQRSQVTRNTGVSREKSCALLMRPHRQCQIVKFSFYVVLYA